MSLTPTEDQRAIQQSARAFLADNAGPERLRAVLAGDAGWDEALWTAMARDLGWVGLMIPEALGGSGLGAAEMALVLEQTGAVLAAAPFFETAVEAVQAITLAGTQAQQADLLPRLAAGELKAALAMTGADGRTAPGGIGVELRREAGGWTLWGRADFVTHGHLADLIIVAARAPGSTGAAGLSLIALPAGCEGLRTTLQPSLDRTRPYSRMDFGGVAVPPDAILGEPEAAGPALERLLAVCAGLLAAEQTGAAAFCLDATVDYVKQRVQFGRPIGSFQAVKHALADMMLKVEAARSAMLVAADAIDQGDEAELFEAAACARAYCSDAFSHCAAQAIQLHGGMGFTWEHHAHLFFKRARSCATLFGEPSEHRERVARLMGLDDPAGPRTLQETA
jgi:alkylation response protein AidB-like acyl-CoA dehydrogenase